MKKERIFSLPRNGNVLLGIVVMVVFIFAFSFFTLSCTGCGPKPKNKTLTQAQKCENALNTAENADEISSDMFGSIVDECYHFENSDKNVQAVIQKHEVTYDYVMLLYDVKGFIEKGVNALVNVLAKLHLSSPEFEPQAFQQGDPLNLLNSMFFSKVMPYMDDANKRVQVLAQKDIKDVSVTMGSIVLNLDVKKFLKTLGVKKEDLDLISDSFKFDLKGKWDYTEVLVIGALDNGIFAIWRLLESQTLGNMGLLLQAATGDYSIDMKNPYQLAGVVAHVAAKIPKILAFEPTEGKAVFENEVRLYLDATLSYLTGRSDDLTGPDRKGNTLTYAVKNPGLFDAIETVMKEDQTGRFVQYTDSDKSGGISYKDEIKVPLLAEANKKWGSFKNPLQAKTWQALLAAGKKIEGQLENYKTAQADLDEGAVLNMVFQDIAKYTKEEYGKEVTIPAIPSDFLFINAGALFKAVTDPTFKGLRSLFPAWVTNPRADDTTNVHGRLDVDKNYTPFDYILVFETEEYKDGVTSTAGPITDGTPSSPLYYGVITPATSEDITHFSLFFDTNGNYNISFFKNDPKNDTDANLANLHEIVADSLRPDSDHDTLLYFGFQSPDFYGLIKIDPGKFQSIDKCKGVPTQNDPQLDVNAFVNCAIIAYVDPIKELFDTLSSSLTGGKQ